MLLGFCRSVCPVGERQQGTNTPVSLSSLSPISAYLPLAEKKTAGEKPVIPSIGGSPPGYKAGYKIDPSRAKGK